MLNLIILYDVAKFTSSIKLTQNEVLFFMNIQIQMPTLESLISLNDFMNYKICRVDRKSAERYMQNTQAPTKHYLLF